MEIKVNHIEFKKTINVIRQLIINKSDFERATYSLCRAYCRTYAAEAGINESLVSWSVDCGRGITFKRFDDFETGRYSVIETL